MYDAIQIMIQYIFRTCNPAVQVVEAKAGKGSATLSMAYAAARMAESTLLGLTGEPNIYECTFVQSDVSGRGLAAAAVLGGACLCISSLSMLWAFGP